MNKDYQASCKASEGSQMVDDKRQYERITQTSGERKHFDIWSGVAVTIVAKY